jgi:hypothetical protein
MSAATAWLGPGVGAGSAALIIVFQPGLLAPVLMTVSILVGLPLLLIVALALIAVYSPNSSRRDAAEKVLDRLLATLRPQETLKKARLRRKKNSRIQ